MPIEPGWLASVARAIGDTDVGERLLAEAERCSPGAAPQVSPTRLPRPPTTGGRRTVTSDAVPSMLPHRPSGSGP